MIVLGIMIVVILFGIGWILESISYTLKEQVNEQQKINRYLYGKRTINLQNSEYNDGE